MVYRRKDKRCWHFDSYGGRKGVGCPNTAHECRFIHPSDPEWNTGYSRRGDSRSPSRSKRSLERSRSRSPRRHHRRSDRSSSPSRSSSHRQDKGGSKPHRLPLRPAKEMDYKQERHLSLSRPTHALPLQPLATSSMPPPSCPKSLTATLSSSSTVVASPSVEKRSPTQQASVPVELSPGEKRKVWVNRIKLVSECCAARGEYIKWEMEVHKCNTLLNSQHIDMLDAMSKKRLEEDYATAVRKCEDSKDEMNATIQKLLQLDDFWPVTTNSDTGSSAKTLEVLHREVDELKKYTADIKFQTDETTGAKRKRLAMDDDAVEQFDDRIQDLEERVTEQENNLHQAEENVLADLTQQMDEKMAHVLANRSSTASHADEAKVLADVEANWKVAESNVLGMRDEIEQMKRSTTFLEEKAQELPKFNQELGINIAKIADRQQQALAEIQQVRREQAALAATLEACAARIAERAMSPPLPTTDQILVAFQGPIEAKMQDSVASILVENRTEIERLLSEHNQMLYNGVYGKLSLTCRMTEMIFAWLKRCDNDGSQSEEP